MITQRTYQVLFQRLHKQTKLWTVSDVEIWLQEINMEVLYPRFKKLSVDGSCLQQLQQNDLRNEIGIKSQLSVDKIMKWIKNGFKQYNNYLKQTNTATKLNLELDHQSCQSNRKNYILQQQDYKIVQQNPLIKTHKFRRRQINRSKINSNKTREQQDSHHSTEDNESIDQAENISSFIQINSLHQKSQSDYNHKKLFVYDNYQKRSVQIENSTFDIGSSDYCCLQLFNPSSKHNYDQNQKTFIDECHVVVSQNKIGHFYLVDMNSISGTFVKITDFLKLERSIQISLGRYHFFLEIIGGTAILSSIFLNIKVRINQYENIYASSSGLDKIQVSQKKMHKSWKKLCSLQKREGIILLIPYYESQVFIKLKARKPYKISDNTQIKIGDNILTFHYFQQKYKTNFENHFNDQFSRDHVYQSCQKFKKQDVRSHRFRNEQAYSNLPNKCFDYLSRTMSQDQSKNVSSFCQQVCIVCFENQRNCLLTKCNHFVLCLRCVKELASCPICRSPIIQIQRVYSHF